MTPEEAKTKWCPFVRYSSGADDNNSANRWDGARLPEQSRCIASDCMAWRWVPYTGWRPEMDDPAGKRTHGYCGAAE